MANASIYSQVAPVLSVDDYQDQAAQREINRLGLEDRRRQNALAAFAFQQQTADRSALQNYAQQSGGDTNKLVALLRGSGSAGLMTQADALEKAQLGRRETESKIGKEGADTSKIQFDTQEAKRRAAIQQVVSLKSPEDAKQLLNQQVASGGIGMQAATALGRLIDTDPEWKLRLVVGISDPKEMQAALAPHMQNAGGALVNTNPLAGPTGQGQINAIPITQSADNAATQATSRQNNIATQAGEDRRAGLSRKTQLQVAGLDPEGKPSGDLEAEAQAVAAGKLPAPTGFAATKPRAQQLIARVMQINPQFDATSYEAKKKAARDFTSGQQGNAMRSFAVAGQHLDQLGELVDALGNGNTQLFNKLGNAFKEQTGSAAPTNFDAAKDVVSKEVVKAIVAGGGGVAERQELSELMSKAKSPAQLKGVITQYRNLMGAQHDALLQQRRAAGLDDSTLPNYSEPNGKPKGADGNPTVSNW